MFILGYYCSDLKTLLKSLSKYKYYFICISLLGFCTIFLVSFFSARLNLLIAFAYTPRWNYDHSIIRFSFRLIGFFSSLIISFGFLFLIPENRFKITSLGENTMNIFLLHMFFVFPINNYLVNMPSYLVLLVSLVSSLLICLLLSSKFSNRIFAPFTKWQQLKLLIKK